MPQRDSVYQIFPHDIAMCSFIHLLSKYVLRAYYVSGILPDVCDISVNKREKDTCSQGATLPVRAHQQHTIDIINK